MKLSLFNCRWLRLTAIVMIHVIVFHVPCPAQATVCGPSSTISVAATTIPNHLSVAAVPILFDGSTTYTGNANLRFHHPASPGNNPLVLALSQSAAPNSTLKLSYEVDNAAGTSPASTVSALLAAGYTSSYWDRDGNGVLNSADFDVNGDNSMTTGSGDYSTMGLVLKLYQGNPGNPLGTGPGTLVYTGYTPIKPMASITYQHTFSIPAAFDYITIESTPDNVGADPRLNEIQLNGIANTGAQQFSQASCLTLTKAANTAGLASPPRAGNVIAYTLNVDASGGNLASVILNDPLGPVVCPGTGNNTVPSIASGSSVTCTLSYALTQSDLDSDGGGDGDIDNTAFVAAMAGGANIAESKSLAVPITVQPNLSIVKTASTPGPVNAGDTIVYTYDIKNIGNVTMTNVYVNDVHNGFGTLTIPNSEHVVIDNAPVGDSTDATPNDSRWSALAPSDTVRYTTSYVVTQKDIDFHQ